MRRALFVLPFLVLSACATPREACIADAVQEVQILDSLIAETRANITRGYAIEERQEIRTIRSFCQGRNADGSTFTYPCETTETYTRSVNVPIDLNAERAKLESMEERQLQNRANADAAVAQCIAIHPE